MKEDHDRVTCGLPCDVYSSLDPTLTPVCLCFSSKGRDIPQNTGREYGILVSLAVLEPRAMAVVY